MTVASAVENQTALAFDSLAAKYDDLFTRSMIGRAQRGAVWDILTNTFEPGSHILELNCGTGEDALFLAKHDISVVACDASERMIETARQRMQCEDPGAPIQFKLLATEHLSKLDRGDLFDGAFSNFSGLNCVADLNQTARDLAALVAMGAPVLICLSTRLLPVRDGLVCSAWPVPQGIPQILRIRNRESWGFHRQSKLSDLASGQAFVFLILSHAFVHRDRHNSSTFVSGTDRAQIILGCSTCCRRDRPGYFASALVSNDRRPHAHPF